MRPQFGVRLRCQFGNQHSHCHHNTTTRCRHFSDRSLGIQEKRYDLNLESAYNANLGNNSYPATGGLSTGGVTGDGDWSGDGDGDWEMGGAWAGGAGPVGTGGSPGYPDQDNWCSEAAEGTAISGVTYSVDACGGTELRLPIRIQEPSSWYRIRVYHGESPCERGDVIADISGQGTGEILDLPVEPPSEGYVTIEYTADGSDYYYFYDDYGYGGYANYYGGGILEVELNPVSGGLIDGE